MININNKQFRNLQEQVAFLTSMIGQATDVVKQIVGRVDTAGELPDPTTYSPGDTFAVGTEAPFEYYTKIDNGWVDVGQFPVEGPQGEPGDDGKSIIVYLGDDDTSGTVYLSKDNLDTTIDIQEGDVIFSEKGNVFIVDEVQSTRVKVEYKFNLKVAVSFDDVTLTGTTHAENIIVSGDTVLDDTEVQGTLTILDGTSAHEAVSKGQMDTALSSKVNSLTAVGNHVYVRKGLSNTSESYGSSPIPGYIAQWTNDGTLKSGTPLADNDVATKKYVDEHGGGGGGGAVNSVNGKTGTVVLVAGDIYATNAQTIQQNLERIDGLVEDNIDDIADLQDTVNTKSTVSGTADGTYWSSITIDGTTKNIPTGGGGGTSDFDLLSNRPKYNNTTMSSTTNIPKVPVITATLLTDGSYSITLEE